MEISDILRYIGPQTLLIIGNRRNVQLEVLKRGTAILITGGFQPTKKSFNMQMITIYQYCHLAMIRS